MNKYARNLASLLFLLVLGCPFIVHAASYSPVPRQREEKAAKGIRVKGETLCLFQSGTEDVKREIKVGDILIVFRKGHELREVGKVRVLLYIGEDYLKGEVVEGEARSGDIAKKGNAASLVISPENRCN